MDCCLFVGSKLLGLSCLAMLAENFPGTVCAAVTIDDSNDGRSVYPEFIALAGRHALALHTLPPGHDLRVYLESYNPAMVFVCGWYKLIAPQLLNVPKRGFIGIHNSLLPRYRGGAPLVWAMINGEAESGFSIFQFTPGMDDGPLFAQRAVAINEDDGIADVLARIEADVPHVLAEIYRPMLNGTLVPTPQSGVPTYAAQRLPEDGQIDWRLPQSMVYNFIRAQSEPYPGAYTFVSGEKVVIQRVNRVDSLYCGRPGQVVLTNFGDILIICGDNRALRIDELWLGGKKVPVKSVFKSSSLRL